jgi:Ca-activated chloride channel homolog
MFSYKNICKGLVPLLLIAACHDGKNYECNIQEVQCSINPIEQKNAEEYGVIVENNFVSANATPLSTFSIDVDHAAYSNVRRFIEEGQMPPNGAVRIEEMINYFDYDYAPPTNADPLAIHSEISSCPWNEKHQLVQISLKGKEISTENLPAANLVFLIDVSGSMSHPNKLPLVQASLKLLTEQLREKDKVAIVTYAGNATVALTSTSGANKTKIIEAIENLESGGCTAGAEGIKTAYEIARKNFIKNGGNNRVILATDGDFNVGVSSDDELVKMIEQERKSNVFLTVLGYGMGNYKDEKMQQLADKGNGNHAYIDNINEAKKVLVNEFGSSLFTIAKDVKLQVEFNPQKVGSYRLIGYENRMLQQEDFNNDKKYAGELGAGHRVTALYEIIPVGVKDTFVTKVDALKYKKSAVDTLSFANEMMNVKIRYKNINSDESKLMVKPIFDENKSIESTSENFRFAASVAEFGMLLRNSDFKQLSSYDKVIALGEGSKGKDVNGYRKAFIELVEKASKIAINNLLLFEK